jgi:3-polyprenyl-4-hydroxybenzoate decarboxylase
VLDELADFELGGGLEDDDAILNEEPLDSMNMNTFGDANSFGDLNSAALPDFFKKPSQLEQENYDLFDSMANQTLDDDLDISKLYYLQFLHPERLISHLL